MIYSNALIAFLWVVIGLSQSAAWASVAAGVAAGLYGALVLNTLFGKHA